MAQRSAISPEVKAAALADLALGEQPAVVAQRYRLSAATVRSWKLRQDATTVATRDATPIATRQPAVEDRQRTLAELVAENLRARLVATQRINEHVARPSWLERQSAAELGELLGTLDRSVFGMLDRLASAQQASAQQQHSAIADASAAGADEQRRG